MDYINRLRSMVGHEKVIMVVAGAFVFDSDNRLLLHQRSDNCQWGLPGGFMELGETIQETARREVFEETGLHLGNLELFGIYSGRAYDKTFANGDQVSMVQVLFTCNEYEGNLIGYNSETLSIDFFPLEKLPQNLFTDHQNFIEDLLTLKDRPVLG